MLIQPAFIVPECKRGMIIQPVFIQAQYEMLIQLGLYSPQSGVLIQPVFVVPQHGMLIQLGL